MQPYISMITLGVADIGRAIQFYEQGLKLPRFAFDSDEVAFFQLNGSWLGLYGKIALAADAGVPEEGSGFPGFTLGHNLPSEEAVDTLFEEVVAVGGAPVKQPEKVFWGGYSGYFKDPDGYLWELAYNPFFWIGPPRSDES